MNGTPAGRVNHATTPNAIGASSGSATTITPVTASVFESASCFPMASTSLEDVFPHRAARMRAGPSRPAAVSCGAVFITVDNVSKSFGARTLFSGVSLRVGARDRIALVGPNGAGKTTLLEIVAGESSPDDGTVSRAKDAVIGYLRQEAIEMAAPTVLDEVLAAASDVTSLEHRLTALEAELASADPADHDRLLSEYGRLRDRFEHAGGYTLEAEARRVL
ncbi:MAG: ABC-F family ATP-binding cassette domain-containing protein, partial [Actinobacteria bacterium]